MDREPSQNPAATHLGWHDRGRLPHFDAADVTQIVTFRLADSLPQSILHRWERELEGKPADQAKRDRRQRIEDYLDAGHGTCWLRDKQVASMVQESLLHFDGVRYRLRAWCVMPNHVHVIIGQRPGHPLHRIVWSWKNWTAKQANILIGRTGRMWQREYHDRYIRDTSHLANAITYVEQNPVKARLVLHASDWLWSSAAGRDKNLGAPQTSAAIRLRHFSA